MAKLSGEVKIIHLLLQEKTVYLQSKKTHLEPLLKI